MSVLFEKSVLNGMSLDNRFVRSATWEARATEDGGPTPELEEFTVDLTTSVSTRVIKGNPSSAPLAIE